eukprot:15334030-Ditylum_brightwellii.AAC.1
MEAVVNSPHIDMPHLEKVKWCQLYRKDIFISDISISDSTIIVEFYNNHIPSDPIDNHSRE